MVRIFIWASFFSPLIVGGSFYFPYIVPKTVFFQVVIELALFFYLLLVVLDKKYAPKLDGLALAVLSFFGVYVLASVFGVNPARSFFGTYERMLSVVNLAHFIALFFMARAVFTGAKDWLWTFRAFLAPAVLVGLYGFGQWLGWEALYHAGAGRIDATIGNAAFVAGYFIFAFFFSAFLLLKDKSQGFKYFYIFSLVLSVWAVYASATRGGMLGLIAAAIVIAVAYIFKKDKKFNFKKEYALTGAVIALAVFGLAFFTGGKANFLSPISRLLNISLEDTTVNTRVMAAQTSWKGFLARPILGWGAENYNLVFDKYYNPKLYPAENWFDRAHNVLFDMLTTVGAAGFTIYLAMLGFLAFLIFRYARGSANGYWLGVFSLALLAAYFVQNVAVFDSLVTYLPFFLFAAFVGGGFLLGEEAASRPAEKKEKIFSNPSGKAALVFLPIFALMIYWVNVRPLYGAYYAVQALQIPPAGSDVALEYFKKSIEYSNFGKHEIRGRAVEYASAVLNDKNISAEAKNKIAQYAIDEMEKNLSEQPLDFRNYLVYANFLMSDPHAFSAININALERTDDVLKKARELGPNKPILYIQWARLKEMRGDTAGLIEMNEKLAALKPDMPEFQARLAMAYLKDGNNGKALELFENLSARQESLNAQTYRDMAVGFAQLGKKEEAIFSAREVAELDPSMKEAVDGFIRQLEAK